MPFKLRSISFQNVKSEKCLKMKEEIVQKFLVGGKLLTPGALELLAKEEAMNVESNENLVITEHDIASPKKSGTEKSNRFRVVKNLAGKKQEVTTDDFARFYRSRFEKIKNIIIDKMQKPFTSLNKLSNYRDEVYVVGIIRDIKEKDGKKIVELEDAKAAVYIIFDKETLDAELDDVVAVQAISSRNLLFGKQIIYPDVPLRGPTTGFGKACFVGGLNINEAPRADVEKFFSWFEEQNIQYLFCAGDVGDLYEFERLVEKHCHSKTVFFIPGGKDTKEEYPQLPVRFNTDKIVSLSNPSMVEVNGVNVLLIHKFAIDMLKKRYLGKTSVILDEDYLVLEGIPDIVCFGHSDKPHIANYKSISIVNSGSMLADFRPIVIDLETREAQQMAI